ncbi:hypothetical protein PSTT_14314, partial [Puccinia striiformis]
MECAVLPEWPQPGSRALSPLTNPRGGQQKPCHSPTAGGISKQKTSNQTKQIQRKRTPKQWYNHLHRNTFHLTQNLSRENEGPRNESSRKASSNNNILIANSDRTLSKKFTSPCHNVTQGDSKLLGLVNSFKASPSKAHLDPMSLVPSPSRGIYTSPKKEENHHHQPRIHNNDHDQYHQEHDLTNLNFQLEFFNWLFKRIQDYKNTYPNRMSLFIYSSLSEHATQKTNQSSTDEDFKVQIDRISSLVREIRKLREGIHASGRKDSFAIVVYELSAEIALESLDFAQLNTLLNHLLMDLYRNKNQSEILNRRIMFARVSLLLPIFFKFVLRKNYVQLNRKFIKPKLEQILKAQHDSQRHEKQPNLTIEWDNLLFLLFLNLMRSNLIWKVIQKSYYHLSSKDDPFISNLLSLEFRNHERFNLQNCKNDRLAYINDPTQNVNSWLHKVNLQRNSRGIIQLK